MRGLFHHAGTAGVATARRRLQHYISRAYTSDLVRKVAETFGTRLLLILIGLITGVIIARILGPEGRGLYATAVTIGAIGTQFGNLGLHASNTYYVAKDQTLLAPLLANSLAVSFCLGTLCALGMGLIFSTWPMIAPLHGSLLILALAWIPFGLKNTLLQNLQIGIYDIRSNNTINLVTKLLVAALLVGLILFQAVTVEAVFIAGFVALVLGLLWILWRLRLHLEHRPRLAWNMLQQGIRYGFKAYLAAFFAFMVLRADLLMVKYLLGAEQAGYYSIAANMAELVYMLPVIIGTLIFPKLSAMLEDREKWLYTQRVALLVGMLMLGITAFGTLLARPVITLLYGYEFLPALPPFIWLMPAVLMLSVNTIFMNYFGSIGMPGVSVYSPGIAALLNLALNLLWIPSMGIVGASLASLAAYTLMLLISTSYILAKKAK